MSRGLIFTIIIALILIVMGALLVFDVGRGGNLAVASFEECARLGYPIMESYPRQCRTTDGRTFIETIAVTPSPSHSPEATSTPIAPSPTPTASSSISVSSIKSGNKITSPFTIKGQARGPWYFEATFPIQLRDANGKVLVETYGEAQGEWTTQQFVPFEAKLVFIKPQTPTGTLVFMNANPSGDPERSLEYILPITFE